MEDFGNIVYVVVAIGWFVWNTYKKSQGGKSKAAPSSPKPTRQTVQETHEKSKTLEDLIFEQLRENRPKPEPIKYESKKHLNQDKFLNTDLTHSHLSQDYQMSRSEMESHRVERQVRKLESEENNEPSVIDDLLPDGVDLRRAVILNAILARPYN